MIKISKTFVAALVAGALVFGVSGCEQKETPAEDAGKKIDQSVEKAGQKIDEAVGKAGREIEKAGKKMDDSVKDAKK